MVNKQELKSLVTTGLLLSTFFVSSSLDALAVGPKTTRSIGDLAQKAKSKPDRPDVDQEIESAAIQLVQTHLTELKPVLERLRAKDTRQYVRAITDLGRSARKLEAAKNRDERLFEIEVEILQAASAVNLLTARLQVRDSEADRKLLRKGVDRLQQAQITRAQYDVDSLQVRLERTEQQLKNARERLKTKQDGSDGQLEKSYVGFLRKAGRHNEPGSTENPSKSSDSKKPVREKNKN